MRIWRQTLGGRLIVALALVLLLAQALNLALLLGESQTRQLTTEQESLEATILPMVSGLIGLRGPGRQQEAQRLSSARASIAVHGDSSVTRRGFPRDPALEQRLAKALSAAGIRFERLEASARKVEADEGRNLGPIPPPPLPPPHEPPPFGHRPPGPPPPFGRESHRQQQPPRPLPPTQIGGTETVVSIEMSPGLWFDLRIISPPDDPLLNLRMAAATLLLYIIVLGAAAFIARRLTRPMSNLADAARRLGRGEPVPALVAEGPEDVRLAIDAFNDMNGRIARLLLEKDAMLGAIGHDLRTPLTSLRIRAENLPESADRTRMIATLDHLSRTVDGILTLAQLGKEQEAPRPTDLAALIETLVDEFHDIGADVTFAGADRLVTPVRPHLLLRLLRNLAENAVKYGERARISLVQDTRGICIIIEDDGPGLPPAAIDRLLQPFERLDGSRSRSTGGSGLGLSIARAIADLHGAGLHFANRPDGGLAVTLVLPAPRL